MHRINELIKILSLSENESIAIEAQLIEKAGNNVPWFMRAFSFFGAFLSALLFIGFLAIANLFDSFESMGLLGIVLIIAGVIFTHTVKDNPLFDPFIISGLILGQVLLVVSTVEKVNGDSLITVGITGIFLETFLFISCKSVTQRFLSILLFFLSLMLIIYDSKQFSIVSLFIGVSVFLFTFMQYKRALFLYLEKRWGAIYNPLKFGLLISSLGLTALSILNKQLEISDQYWYIGTLLIALTLGTLIINTAKENKWTNKFTFILLLGIAIILTPSINAPGIGLAILLIISGFKFNCRPTIFLGILGMLVFISAFYYSLQITLLIKSFILMISGILFISAFISVNKFWPPEEII